MTETEIAELEQMIDRKVYDRELRSAMKRALRALEAAKLDALRARQMPLSADWQR